MRGKNDIMSGTLLGVVAAIYLATAYQIQIPFLLQASGLNAASVPKLWGWGLLLLSVVLLIRGLITATRNSVQKKRSGSMKEGFCEFFRQNRDVVLSILLLVCYIALLEKIGFIICTVLYVFCTVMLLSPTGTMKKHLVGGVALSVSFSVILAYVFVRLLSMPLPQGLLGW